MPDSNRLRLVFNGRQQPQLIMITELQHSKAGKPREKGDKHQQVKPACQQGTANSKASLPAYRTHTHTTSLTPTTYHLPHTHITSLTLTHSTSLTPTPPLLTPPPLTQCTPHPHPPALDVATVRAVHHQTFSVSNTTGASDSEGRIHHFPFLNLLKPSWIPMSTSVYPHMIIVTNSSH